MSLGLAINNALSGLSVSQRSLATTAGNITNANTEGYSRKSVQANTEVSAGVGVGATSELKRLVDDFLVKAQRSQFSSTSKAAVHMEYMERLQVYLGKPGNGEGPSIMSELDAFFSATSDVSGSPEQAFFRTQAVKRGDTLAQTIANLAKNLQQTRFQAEQDIAGSIAEANLVLDRLNAVNTALRESYVSGQSQDELFDTRDATLKELAEYIDVGVNFDASGQANIFNQAGEILSSSSRYHITYSPAGSADTFKNDKKLGKMEIVGLDDAGNPTDYKIELSTGGFSSEITTKLQDGKIKGLMEIRDIEIPRMLAQLDSLANGLRDEMNKIHNDGVGFPPPASLTGTRQLRADQEVGFTGSIRVAALKADGKPAVSPYTTDADSQFRPLKLDFSKIHGPDGEGRPTVADIMNEINQFYDAPADRVRMAGIADMRLIAVSDDTTGPFEFQIEMDNASKSTQTVTIVSINAVAQGDDVDLAAGEVDRSGIYSVAGAGPYSIDVEVQLTDPDTGLVYNDTITYTIPAAASGLRNDRYSVASLLGGAAPPQRAEIIAPSNNNHMLTARMVDGDGNVVTDSTVPAYLQIVGENGLRVGLDELTSEETGISTSTVAGTGRGFSHYFELNNFFNENRVTTLGAAAQNLSVRQALKNDPNLMSVGELTQVSQPSGDSAAAIYAYSISSGSNQVAERIADLRNSAITFAAAGTLPSYTDSVSAYASEIYAYVGGAYNYADSQMKQQQIIGKTYDDRMSNVSGVNLDEELANTVLFQNAYSASARIITVVSTLFDVLLGINN